MLHAFFHISSIPVKRRIPIKRGDDKIWRFAFPFGGRNSLSPPPILSVNFQFYFLPTYLSPKKEPKFLSLSFSNAIMLSS